MILAKVPEAVVDGRVGRRSSFEVKINDEIIFSKLDNGSFPDFDEIVSQVENVKSGKKIEKVTKTQSGCVIC
jgi:selenoprotein W-related protein